MALSHLEKSKQAKQEDVVDPSLSPFEDPQSSQFGVMHPLDIGPPTPSPPKEKPAELQASEVQGTPAELLARKQILQDLKQRMQERSASQTSSPVRPPEGPQPPDEETYYDTDSELNVDQRLDLLDAANDKHFKRIYEIQLQLDTLGNKVALLSGDGVVPHQNLLRKTRYDMTRYSSPEDSPENTAVFDIASPQQPTADEAQALEGLQEPQGALHQPHCQSALMAWLDRRRYVETYHPFSQSA